jgi:siroheme synthase-like protein
MSSNRLFPVFLQLENLQLLIVGGGFIGMEKLGAVLSNSPATTIKLVAISISDEIKELAIQYPGMTLIEKAYEPSDLENVDLAIVAVNDIPLAERIRRDTRQKRILVNVADKPSLCDFYLGSIVQKGNLKLAISTNGKSPTVAKRLKEVLNEMLPEEMEKLLDNMQAIRNSLKGDFTDKVRQLNQITEMLVQGSPGEQQNFSDK